MTPTLAVTRLILARFRSHEAADVSLDGRPVAIFGPNGAGKTNLIEAVSMLSPGRGLRGAASEDLAQRGDLGGWQVRAAIAGPCVAHEVATRSEGGGRIVAIDGKAATQSGLGAVARVLWLTPAMDRLWMDAASERRRFLDRVTLSLHPRHGDAALAYDRALRERNRLLRDGARDAAWYEALEGRMAEFGAQVVANRIGALAALARAPAAEGFPAPTLTLEREGPGDAAGMAAAWRAGRGRDIAAGRSLTGPHRDDLGAVYAAKGLAARLCSTGEQKAMLISLILGSAFAVAQDFGAAPVLLLDEVAAHLDAARRAALYAAVSTLGAQAFMTATGPELFDEMGDLAQRFEVREAGGTSAVRPR